MNSFIRLLACLSLVSASPLLRPRQLSPSDQLSNGQAAQKLNAQYEKLKMSDPCHDGDIGCINGDFAECANGAWVNLGCAPGLQCFAVPLVNSVGTSVICDTQTDAEARIAATGATGGITGTGSVPKTSSTAAPSFIHSPTGTATTSAPEPSSTDGDDNDDCPDDEDPEDNDPDDCDDMPPSPSSSASSTASAVAASSTLIRTTMIVPLSTSASEPVNTAVASIPTSSQVPTSSDTAPSQTESSVYRVPTPGVPITPPNARRQIYLPPDIASITSSFVPNTAVATSTPTSTPTSSFVTPPDFTSFSEGSVPASSISSTSFGTATTSAFGGLPTESTSSTFISSSAFPSAVATVTITLTQTVTATVTVTGTGSSLPTSSTISPASEFATATLSGTASSSPSATATPSSSTAALGIAESAIPGYVRRDLNPRGFSRFF